MKYAATDLSDLIVPFVAVPVADEQVDTLKKSTEQSSIWERFLTMALPLLLFVQFGIFFYIHDDSVSTLHWAVVNSSILLYMLTTHLYQKSLEWMGCFDYTFLILLPELVVVICMALCCFGSHVVVAFLLLVVTKVILALIVVVVHAYRLFLDDDDEEDDDSMVVINSEQQSKECCKV